MAAPVRKCVFQIVRQISPNLSYLLRNGHRITIFQTPLKCEPPIQCARLISTTTPAWQEKTAENINESEETTTAEEKVGRGRTVLVVDPETSVRYLDSKSYHTTYGNEPVWPKYRRNFKGHFAPKHTRKTCVRKGKIATGNPCPICRDDFLVVDYTNVKLLKQFLLPQTGEVISFSKTGLCQRQHKILLAAIEKAKDYGFIEEEVPFREFDYSEYYPTLKS